MPNISGLLGSIADPSAKTKVTLKEGDQTITVERTPEKDKGLSVADVIAPGSSGLMGGTVGGMSPSPVADNQMINVTSGEYVVNQPAAQKYKSLLEDINMEGRETLARGGWTGKPMMDGYAQGGMALSNKISKIHKEGYDKPGQAYAIAKSMGYFMGGEIMPVMSSDVAGRVRQSFAIGGQVDPATSLQQNVASRAGAIGTNPFVQRQQQLQDASLIRQQELEDVASAREYELQQKQFELENPQLGRVGTSVYVDPETQQKYYDTDYGFISATTNEPAAADTVNRLQKLVTDIGGSFSSRAINIAFRDKDGLLQVVAGSKGPDGYYVDTADGLTRINEAYPGARDIRIATKSDDPGVEEGAGGIPNAISYSEKLKAPTFNFQREGEQKVYGYALRAAHADANLTNLENTLVAQGEQQALGDLYTGLLSWAANNSTTAVSPAVINKVINNIAGKAPVLNKYRRSMSKYLQAVLRTDTGAAYTGTEIADYIQAFGIIPGEAVTPDLLQDLQSERKIELTSLASRSGDAATYVLGLLAGDYPLPANRELEDFGGAIDEDSPSGSETYDFDFSN